MDIGKHSPTYISSVDPNPSSTSGKGPGTYAPLNPIGVSALVLDDNLANNMIIKGTLSRLGVHCTTFNLSELAVEELSHKEPDILFIDYNMPDINGIDFVSELRASDLIRGSKLVCITADTSTSTKSMLDEHFDQVLYKPVRQKVLNEIIFALKVSLSTPSHINQLLNSSL